MGGWGGGSGGVGRDRAVLGGVMGEGHSRDGVRTSEKRGSSVWRPRPEPVRVGPRPWETSGLGLAEAPLFICISPDVN